MDKRNLAFGKINFILLAAGVLIVVIGFLLMGGDGSTAARYNPDIFSPRRIKVAPVVTFVGFVFIIYAVLKKPKGGEATDNGPLTMDGPKGETDGKASA